MRDPVARIDPKTEVAIEHAVKLLKPFVEKDRFWVRDPPWDRILKELKSIDDGHRRTLGEWEMRAESIAKVSHPRGHPSYSLRRAVILLVLDEIAAFGFRPRRNQANYDDPDKRPSGRSIVSAALERLGMTMPEARVVDLIRPLRRRRG